MNEKHKEFQWIPAQWPAPDNIHAGTTNRSGGVSKRNFLSLNMANHVGDDLKHVVINRQRLIDALALPSEPVWLTQTHSSYIINLDEPSGDPEADGAFCSTEKRVCCVLTADCLPLLMCNTSGTRIAAIHVGWRGLSNGIIDNAIQCFDKSDDVLVWIGPGISSQHYEVGMDVYQACIDYLPEARTAFSANRCDHWLVDLKMIVQLVLKKFNIDKIYDSDLCTYTDKDKFYSYRRDGICGRMASIIWME